MGKVELNKKEKESRLLRKAFQLFTTKGIHKTTISDIVSEAGVAKGTFYLYFHDKYELADQLIARKTRAMCERAAVRMNQAGITGAENRVIFIMDDLIQELARTPMLLHFINKNLSWGIFSKALNRGEDRQVIRVQRFYQYVFQDEIDDFIDLQAMLYIIIEMAGSTCHSVILEQDPMSLEVLRPHLHRSVRAIIRSFRKAESSQSTILESKEDET